MSKKPHRWTIILITLAVTSLFVWGCGSDDPTEPEIDTEAPSVSITNPADDAVIADTATIVATATDNVGVTRVAFTIDNTAYETDSASPWSCAFDATEYDNNSSHTIQATAYDAAGNNDVSDIITVTCLYIDEVPPAAVADLAVSAIASTSITLSWTAPGDDANVGTATEYDIRYALETITVDNWAAATQCTGEPTPQVAGSDETFTVTGLTEDTEYFFAIRTSDEEPNLSDLSNCPSGTTVDVVTFADANLEAIIRDSLGVSAEDDVTPDDLLVLTILHANGKNISLLGGIEYCLNLQTIYLENNLITDVTPLVPLVNLSYLDLYWNDIDDICPLVDNSGLGTGDYISIGGNGVSPTDACVIELVNRDVTVDFSKK